MAKAIHTCTGCVPIDASIIEAYVALITMNKNVSDAEDARVEAEDARVLAENARVEAEEARAIAETERERVSGEDHETAVSDHDIAVLDNETATADHNTAVLDHETAVEDHNSSTEATARANNAAAAAEHMVDIKQGPKGDQGNTGSSVDYPYELVNNVTTDDATKGLSAAQGVVLDGKISQLGQDVKVIDAKAGINLTIADFIYDVAFLTADDSEIYGASRLTTPFLQVAEGQKIVISLNGYSNTYMICAFNPSFELVGESSYYYNGEIVGHEYVVPAGIRYLRFSTKTDYAASAVTIHADSKDTYSSLLVKKTGHFSHLSGADLDESGTIGYADGAEITNSNYQRSGFLPISAGDVIRTRSLYGASNNVALIAFYNINKDFISAVNVASAAHLEGDYVAPSGSCYVRLSNHKDNIGGVDVKIFNSHSTGELISAMQGNRIIEGFGRFSLNSFTRQTDGSVLSAVRSSIGSPCMYPFMSCEDYVQIVTKFQIKQADGSGNFIVLAGKYTTVNYNARLFGVAKNNSGYYFGEWWYNGSWNVSRSQSIDNTTISLNTDYWIRITKEVTNASILKGELLDQSGNVIATITDNDALYSSAPNLKGHPCVMVGLGQAQFYTFSLSYKMSLRPVISVFGDSLIDGNADKSNKDKRYVALLQQALGIKECLINGWGGAYLVGDAMPRVLDKILKVNTRYTMLEYGLNDVSNSTFDTWKNGVLELVAIIKHSGSVPILVCPTYTSAMFDGEHDAQKAVITQMCEWIRQSGEYYVDANDALFDSSGWRDESYHLADGIHFSPEGHQVVFNRMKIDVPFLFDL